MTARERERILLIEHDRRMRQPVSVLFPPNGPRMTSICRHCKTPYERSAHAGKSRGFCTERCRDAWCDERRGRVRLGRGTPRIPQSNRRRPRQQAG